VCEQPEEMTGRERWNSGKEELRKWDLTLEGAHEKFRDALRHQGEKRSGVNKGGSTGGPPMPLQE